MRIKVRFTGEQCAMVVGCDSVQVLRGALFLNNAQDGFKVVIAPGGWSHAFDTETFDDMDDDA